MDVEVLQFQIPFIPSLGLLLLTTLVLFRLKNIYSYLSIGLFIYFLVPHLIWITIFPGISLSFSNTISLIVFGYALYKYRHYPTYKNQNWNLLLLFMIIYVTSSIIIPLIKIIILQSFNLSFTQWLSRMFLPTAGIIAFCLLLSKIKFNDYFIEKIAKIFVLYGIIIIIDGNIGYILGGWRSILEFVGGSTGRLSTLIAGGPDQTVRFLTLGLLSAYFLYRGKYNKLLIFLFLLSIPVYIFSVTRGGYIIFLALLIFILFQNIRKGFILTIIGLVITIPFIGDLFNLLSDTFINIRGDELNDSSTIEYRFYRWNYLFNFINENYNDFIFGTGINNFNKFINSEYKFSIDHAISGSTLHNFFLDVLLSTGLLGIVFILKYFFIVVRKLIKTDYSINSQFYCVVFSIIVILMLMDISWEHIYILPLTIIFMTNSKYLNLSTNLK